ncbi:hypothetical protein TVAG_344350 [Trichomonas vaginalis G3]|uniref:Uncharacterized protein n=1 Tax=Trichomonas vaginalis (strain ATCC PRA-98 / G3) TaxID=412133 RepID=A2E7Q6_TRIV3|nr:hypothetical protein TVAGG3_0598760 [Trichomonas vaginalis G3]EAX77531.1 hypothetical protein TVAG_060730 [Trichomonas vaginalis G3]EAY11341.1 hypothetical protein TVAG_344350 [Trichomonas vaginalis G3]KAI5523787.1 hypothetical protein TVAGG3_0598760 [Trichomonas vaginalis G3]|eukprot:XP_001290461.1 hypothetical protein [Trichomonas vaginalis G3]
MSQDGTTPAPASPTPDMMVMMMQMMQQQTRLIQQMQEKKTFNKPAKNSQDLEAGLNALRNDYKREQMTFRKKGDEDYDNDPIEEDEIKSTASTKTLQDERDDEGFLTKSQRLFVLEFFTLSALRSMRNWKGRVPMGSNKREILRSAVPLIKTKVQLMDFILSAYPDEI